jgi:hypothetical protein
MQQTKHTTSKQQLGTTNANKNTQSRPTTRQAEGVNPRQVRAEEGMDALENTPEDLSATVRALVALPENTKRSLAILLLWGKDNQERVHTHYNEYLSALYLAENYLTCDAKTRSNLFDLSMG